MLDIRYLHQLFEYSKTPIPRSFKPFSIGKRLCAPGGPPWIMGVVNLSADSWYRESVCLSTNAAVRRGRTLASQGADIIDIGAESSLANAMRQDASSQEAILIPVITQLASLGMIVSVETYSVQVAKAALSAGASVLNLTGTLADETVFKLAADANAAVVMCHVQGANVREVTDYQITNDPVGAMMEHFKPRIETATKCGLNQIFVDPGLGFYYRNLQDSALRIRHQMRVFLETFRLAELGFPVCHALPHAFEFFGEEVRSAEPFFATLAALGSTNLFRTHEVPKVKAVLDTMALIS